MKTEIYAHSSIRIEADGKVLCFDPFRVSAEPHDADVIFFTHSHYDHFSPEDFAKLAKEETVFVAPESMRKEAEGMNCVFLKPGETKEIAGFSVEGIRAYNPAKQFHPKENDWLGYAVRLSEGRIYVCGDTDRTPEAEAVACDVVFAPVGGKYTMDAKEAAELINIIRPKLAIPTHYAAIIGSEDDGKTFAGLLDEGIACELYI